MVERGGERNEQIGEESLGCLNVRVNSKQVNYRVKNWLLALAAQPQSAGIMQDAMCVQGQQQFREWATSRDHLLCCHWLKTQVQPRKGRDTGSRKWKPV